MDTSRSTFVLELTRRDVMVIVQLLHIGMLQEGLNEDVIKEVFASFSSQVSGVKKNPRQHGVFPSDLTASKGAIKFVGKYIIPVEK